MTTTTETRYPDAELAEAIRRYVFEGELPHHDDELTEAVLQRVCASESDAER